MTGCDFLHSEALKDGTAIESIGMKVPRCSKCDKKMHHIGYRGWNLIWACLDCNPKIAEKLKER